MKKHERQMRRATKGLFVVALLLVGISSLPVSVSAQNTTISMSLHTAQFELNRLAPGILTSTASFDIDECTSISVEIIAPIGTLSTSITGPNGEILSSGTVQNFGGSFAV